MFHSSVVSNKSIKQGLRAAAKFNFPFENYNKTSMAPQETSDTVETSLSHSFKANLAQCTIISRKLQDNEPVTIVDPDVTWKPSQCFPTISLT